MAFPINPSFWLGTKDPASAHVKPPWILSHPVGCGQHSYPWELRMRSGWCAGCCRPPNTLLTVCVWGPSLTPSALPTGSEYSVLCFVSPTLNQELHTVGAQQMFQEGGRRQWRPQERLVASVYSMCFRDNSQCQKSFQARGFLCQKFHYFTNPFKTH